MERDGNVFGIQRTTTGSRRLVLAVCTTAVVAVSPVTSSAQAPGELPLYGPAELVRSLRLPGAADEIRRPLSVYVDHHQGEVFVADSGSNRIVVFDRDGLYRYQFDCTDRIGTPLGVAVDSQGYVFVLGTSRQGQKLLRFDFDGLLLGEVDLGDLDGRRVRELTIDAEDRLVLLDDRWTVHVLGYGGTRIHEVDVGTVVPDGEQNELILGRPIVRNGRIWIPASTLGFVLVFDLESGEFERSIGVRGNTPGQLNFPVAVDVTPEGVVTVLDRMRFAVVCYSTEGRFLGEFGGKGFRDGWFYHPNLLAVSDDDRVIVGQMLDGRIQVCRIPRYVRTRLVQFDTDRGEDDEVTSTAQLQAVGDVGATLRTP